MCPLCGARAPEFFHDKRTGQIYKLCPRCALCFLEARFRLSDKDERKRYETHRNDLADPAYLDYVRPLADLLGEFKPPPAFGLDFGSGPAPVMSHLLTARGYTLKRFDPYFEPDAQVLELKYDFIVASEVAEHFYNPKNEFEFLRARLRPGGALGLMTSLFEPSGNFSEWHYRRDPTHVCFYSAQTFEWIREHFGFAHLEIRAPRTILLTIKG